MRYPLPTWLIPVNIFQIAGVCCCPNMHKSRSTFNLSKHFFCYDARTIQDANMLVVWGYTPPKLVALLPIYYSYLPKKHFILHIDSCGGLPNFQLVPEANLSLRCNSLVNQDLKHIIKEARQCLRA